MNSKTPIIVSAIFVVACLCAGTVFGQGGTGRETPKPAPKNSPSTKKPTARNPVSRTEPACTAQSPTRATGRTNTANLNGVRLEMVEIPTGSFCMGSTNDDREKPVHQVTINYSFYMGKYEVTQAQWQAVMGNNPSRFTGDNLPVQQVSWDDVQWFFQKLNQVNDGYTYRLPTESEWEYACRAGTTGDYAGYLDGMAWHYHNSGEAPHAVGMKQPNSFGLFDMYGNVSEWCQDWYLDSYRGAPTDGSATQTPDALKARITRGGSWSLYGVLFTKSAARSAYTSETRGSDIGFRVVAVR